MTAPFQLRRSRTILRVWGREPVKMVHGLATADIEAVTDDRGTYTAFLNPKGKMVADARVFAMADELLMVTDPGAQEELLAHLRKFIPPLFARFEDVSDEWAVIGVYGQGATAAARAAAPAAGLAEPTDDWADLPEDAVALRAADPSALLVRTGEAGSEGWEFLVPADGAEPLERALEEAGSPAGTEEDLEALRVRAGRPRWGAELTDAVIPLEAGLLERAISQTKGCYTGQEVIVRILHRGHVNRHLRRLVAEGDAAAALAPGDELFEPGNDRPRGTITSVADQDGGALALGYVRREIEPPATVRVGGPDGPEVRVEALES